MYMCILTLLSIYSAIKPYYALTSPNHKAFIVSIILFMRTCSLIKLLCTKCTINIITRYATSPVCITVSSVWF